MDDREFEKILSSAEQLRLREKEAEPWTDRYSDMNSMENQCCLTSFFPYAKLTRQKGNCFWPSSTV